jgi:hypothetical protein
MSDRRSPVSGSVTKRHTLPGTVVAQAEIAQSPRLYTSKQMEDACDMVVATELTLAGVSRP